MTEYFDNLVHNVEDGVKLINDSEGFTVTGWNNRGNVQDRTVVIQNENEHFSKYSSSNNPPMHIINRTI